MNKWYYWTQICFKGAFYLNVYGGIFLHMISYTYFSYFYRSSETQEPERISMENLSVFERHSTIKSSTDISLPSSIIQQERWVENWFTETRYFPISLDKVGEMHCSKFSGVKIMGIMGFEFMDLSVSVRTFCNIVIKIKRCCLNIV